MTVSQYLYTSTNYLITKRIPSARLDVLILLEFVTAVDRAKLLAEPHMELSLNHINLLNHYIQQRAAHLPISYITNSAYFYGRRFYVDSSVMQPRPESEDMIDMLKSIVASKHELKKLQTINIADIGTGSGCLGITAALEVTNAIVDLIDIDEKALEIAKKNVVLHTMDINIIKADLLPENNKNYDVLLCNLPYLPDDLAINEAAIHEPKIALFGGKDGLDIYRKLFKKVVKTHKKPLFILIESLPESHKSLQSIASADGYQLSDSIGYIQEFKLI